MRLTWKNKPQDVNYRDHCDEDLVRKLNKLPSNKWIDILIHSENTTAVSSLLNSSFRNTVDNYGGVKLIYIDPPYLTGKSQMMKKDEVEKVAFDDKYNNSLEEYLSQIFVHLSLLKNILSEAGSIYIHVDYRTSSYIKVIMDEIFGSHNLKGYIIWNIDNGAKSRKFWSNQHNDILVYSKTNKFIFNAESEFLKTQFSDVSLKTHFRKIDKNGRNYRERKINSKSYRYYADEGKLVGSVWNDLKSMKANSPLMKEYTPYPTQKPISLLNRIISASSDPGDIILDTFCGSGTSLIAAANLNRKWIGVDIGDQSISTINKRMDDKTYQLINSNYKLRS